MPRGIRYFVFDLLYLGREQVAVIPAPATLVNTDKECVLCENKQIFRGTKSAKSCQSVRHVDTEKVQQASEWFC